MPCGLHTFSPGQGCSPITNGVWPKATTARITPQHPPPTKSNHCFCVLRLLDLLDEVVLVSPSSHMGPAAQLLSKRAVKQSVRLKHRNKHAVRGFFQLSELQEMTG